MRIYLWILCLIYAVLGAVLIFLYSYYQISKVSVDKRYEIGCTDEVIGQSFWEIVSESKGRSHIV